MATARTILASVAPVPAVDGQLVTVPATGGILVPDGFGYRALELIVNLSLVDKLAIGNTLELSSFFSLDNGITWQFVNGFNWQSYGSIGLTILTPEGIIIINPDPTLGIPLNDVTGQLMRLAYQTVGLATVGITLNGIS